MADYRSVLSRAVEGLTENTPENRRVLYERARAALERQLAALGAAVGGDQAQAQFSALDSAVAEIESRYGVQPSPPPQPVQAPLPPEQPSYQAPPPPPSPLPGQQPPPSPPPRSPQPEPVDAEPQSSHLEPVNPEPTFDDGGQRYQEAAPPAGSFYAAGASELTQRSEDVVQENEARLQRAVREFGIHPDLAHGTAVGNNYGDAGAYREQAPQYADYPDTPHPQPGDDYYGRQAEPEFVRPEATSFGYDAPLPGSETGVSGDSQQRPVSAKLTIGIVALLAVVIGGAVIYEYGGAFLGFGDEGEEGAVVAETDDGGPKIEDRVPSAEETLPAPEQPVRQITPETVEQTVPAPAPVEVPAVQPAVPQSTAILYEEAAAADGSDLRLDGGVVWSLEPDAVNTSIPTIKADVTVPERSFALTMTFRLNTDQTLPASHTVELLFQVGDDGRFGDVAGIGTMSFKANEPDAGEPLSSSAIGPYPVSEGVDGNFFFVVLSDIDQDRSRNEAIMRSGQWIDVPILYSSGKRAILTLDKGEEGNAVFAEAFAQWGGG